VDGNPGHYPQHWPSNTSAGRPPLIATWPISTASERDAQVDSALCRASLPGLTGPRAHTELVEVPEQLQGAAVGLGQQPCKQADIVDRSLCSAETLPIADVG
jgi:hypothetical protein